MDISVVIPIYNVEKYLKECLDSVVNQTLENIEIICVDDGSTDSSLNILYDYKSKYQNITVISQKNCGSSVARNKGLEIAKGKYIYFLDSDDYLDNNALELCFKESEENDLDILLFDARVICEEEGVSKYKDMYRENIIRSNVIGKNVITGEEAFNLMVEGKCSAHTTWLQLFRHEFLKNIGISFYTGIVHQDAIHSIISNIKAKRVKHIGKVLHTYRLRENSITTSKISGKNIKGNYVVASELYKFYQAYVSCNCNDRTCNNILEYSKKFYKDAIYSCDILNELDERVLIKKNIPKKLIDIKLMIQMDLPKLYYKNF